MPYIVVTTNYPTHISRTVTERYIKVTQEATPDETLGTAIVPIAAKQTEKGLHLITIFQVAEGKLEEALKRTAVTLTNFHDIEGHEASMDVYMTLEEGLATTGMSMPG